MAVSSAATAGLCAVPAPAGERGDAMAANSAAKHRSAPDYQTVCFDENQFSMTHTPAGAVAALLTGSVHGCLKCSA